MIWIEFRQNDQLVDLATAGTPLQMIVYTQQPSVADLTVTGNIRHPDGTEEPGLDFEPNGSGKYLRDFTPDAAGAYEVTVTATHAGYRPSTFTRNLFCKQKA